MPKKTTVVRGKSATAPGQMKPAGSSAKAYAPGQATRATVVKPVMPVQASKVTVTKKKK